ncbi:MAG: hypothetical protein A3J28_11625 [Acidobacteria bacterium RIFCSPLOWO2_12_FULL_60_22]|nr:MAG: hypothetical protein A3J28_11625 [Acidobacteria bacterium RIFCSPLOWO2_12_FULL_60_22]
MLSEAKHLLVAERLKQKQILRFAQDDKRWAQDDSGMDVSSTYLWDTTHSVEDDRKILFQSGRNCL